MGPLTGLAAPVTAVLLASGMRTAFYFQCLLAGFEIGLGLYTGLQLLIPDERRGMAERIARLPIRRSR